MIERIDHVVLVVRDIAAAIAFYRDVLGLEILGETEWRRGERPFPSLKIGAANMLNVHQADYPHGALNPQAACRDNAGRAARFERGLRPRNRRGEVSEGGRSPPPSHQAGSEDLCFVWDGPIEDAVTLLDAKNVPIELGPVKRRGARGVMGTSVYFRDPDGNLLELMSYR